MLALKKCFKMAGFQVLSKDLSLGMSGYGDYIKGPEHWKAVMLIKRMTNPRGKEV